MAPSSRCCRLLVKRDYSGSSPTKSCSNTLAAPSAPSGCRRCCCMADARFLPPCAGYTPRQDDANDSKSKLLGWPSQPAERGLEQGGG